MRSAAARLGRRRRRTETLVVWWIEQPSSNTTNRGATKGGVLSFRRDTKTRRQPQQISAPRQRSSRLPRRRSITIKRSGNRTRYSCRSSRTARTSSELQMWSNDFVEERRRRRRPILLMEEAMMRRKSFRRRRVRSHARADWWAPCGRIIKPRPGNTTAWCGTPSKNHDAHAFEQIVKSSGKIEKMYTTKLMTSEDAELALKAAKELVDKYGGGPRHGLWQPVSDARRLLRM